MKRLLPLAVLLVFCARAVSAETEPVKFHVQLIYATNSDKPPQKGWKKVGPKLQKKLSPVFKWKELWEVSRTEVSVPAGQGAKAKLTAERELEIRFQKDGRLELLLYRNAEVVRKMKNMAANERIIMGGESTDRDAWFAVVRRDKPSTE